MNSEEAVEIVMKYSGAVESGYYLRWNLVELVGVRDQLRGALQALLAHAYYRNLCKQALAAINERIGVKESEAKASEEAAKAEKTRLSDDQAAERRHKENKRIQIAALVLAGILIPVALAIWQHNSNKNPANTEPSTRRISHPEPSKPMKSPTPYVLAIPAPAKAYSPTSKPAQKSTPKP